MKLLITLLLLATSCCSFAMEQAEPSKEKEKKKEQSGEELMARFFEKFYRRRPPRSHKKKNLNSETEKSQQQFSWNPHLGPVLQRDLKTGKMLILESNKGSSHYSFTMKEEKPSKEEEPTQYPDDPEVQAFFDEFDKASRKRREKEKQRKAKEQSKTKTQTHKEFNPNVWRNPTTGKLMYLEGNNS